MNKPRSCIGAFFLISCVWTASGIEEGGEEKAKKRRLSLKGEK